MSKYLLVGFTVLLISGFFSVECFAQKKPVEVPQQDTAKQNVKKETKPGPKTFQQLFGGNMNPGQGLFPVYKADDKYYFEIADSLIGRLVMAITRIAKAPTGAGYGGQEVNRQVLQWEKGPDNKLFLRCVGFVNISSDSTQSIFEAVQNSNVDPITGVFEIKAIRKDTSSIVDVTDFFKGDNQVVSLPSSYRQFYRFTGLMPDRSFIKKIKSFPINTEVVSVKTYGLATGMPAPPSGPQAPSLPTASQAGVATLEINTSIILLPARPMRKRLADYRVGYFVDEYAVYADNSQRAQKETFIQRFRLEPKNAEDEQKARRGELIEPARPIIFYIDPATPRQYVKYFIQGVNDWNRSFEKAGWKNAIQGREWPLHDTSMSLDDARFNVIRYFASEIENAQGPRVHDPRSGEIIETHIYWYHNVINIFKHLYAIQVGHLDPRAQKADFDEELVGRIIRYVASHEVGHTIGLLHNHGASSAVSVKNLRDRNFLKEYGISPSIMEYARLNYVAQAEDSIALEDLWSKIGIYDDWAITYGYKLIFDKTDEYSEKEVLNQWLKVNENNRMLRFGIEQHPYDPSGNSEDLSDNPMEANEYGIRNLKKMLPLQILWTRQNGKFSEYLNERYNMIVVQMNWYFSHVTKFIGGIYDNPKLSDDEGSVYQIVPRQLQKQAVDFLSRHLFDTPNWLLNKEIIGRIRPDNGVNRIRELQESVLASVFAFSRMQRLIENAAADKTAYTLNNLFDDMQRTIWKELTTGKQIDVYRRNLQKAFVENMSAILAQKTIVPAPGGFLGVVSATPTNPARSDIFSEAKATLRWVQVRIKAALPSVTDAATKNHLVDISDRITAILDAKKN